MQQKKNFLSPILKDYKGDITKRWRVECYERDENCIYGKRCVTYGNINVSTDSTERRKAAAQLIQEIKGRKNKVSLLQFEHNRPQMLHSNKLKAFLID